MGRITGRKMTLRAYNYPVPRSQCPQTGHTVPDGNMGWKPKYKLFRKPMTCIAVSALKQDKWILMEIWEETRVQNEKGSRRISLQFILKQDKLLLMEIWEESRVQNDTGAHNFPCSQCPQTG